jgi:hypothetical protein
MSTKRKMRLPKDLREAIEAYLRLGPKSYVIFFELSCSAGEDVPWCLDRRGYEVPRSIAEIGKPIELSARERAEAERAPARMPRTILTRFRFFRVWMNWRLEAYERVR